MPIKKRWSEFSRDNLGKVPKTPGVYELSNSKGDVMDIGSSGNLQQRLKAHKSTGDKGRPAKFRFEVSGILENHKDAEGLHSEKYKQLHRGNLPPKQKRAPRI